MSNYPDYTSYPSASQLAEVLLYQAGDYWANHDHSNSTRHFPHSLISQICDDVSQYIRCIRIVFFNDHKATRIIFKVITQISAAEDLDKALIAPIMKRAGQDPQMVDVAYAIKSLHILYYKNDTIAEKYHFDQAGDMSKIDAEQPTYHVIKNKYLEAIHVIAKSGINAMISDTKH